MSETGKLAQSAQDQQIWASVSHFAELPDWLSDARNSELVFDRLSHLVPEFTQGDLVLKEVDIGHIRFKNDFWTAHCELHVARPNPSTGEERPEMRVIHLIAHIYPPGQIAEQKATVRGTLGAPGWKAVLPDLHLELRTQEPEKVLAALDELKDPERSRQLLSRLIQQRGGKFADYMIYACKPNVVRYKPGSRCTVVYHLEYEPDLARGRDWPKVVVAKTYRGEKGQNAFDSMDALWNSPLGRSSTVKIAEALAYDPERKVLVQGPIREETTLKDLLVEALTTGNSQTLQQVHANMRLAGRGLAELHNSGLEMGYTWTWDDEVGEVRDRVDRLSEAVPELAKAAAPLLDRLNELAAAVPPDPLIPAHGSFRPAQVLLYKGEIGFIDFDSFSQSEPSNDLALYLCTVMSLSVTQKDKDGQNNGSGQGQTTTRAERYEKAAEICETFLQAYESVRPVSRERLALWQSLDFFMFILQGWVKIKVREMDDLYFLLEQTMIRNKIVEAQ